MKKMVIKLTPEQHARLKAVLDRALEERPENLNLQDLWHACARATTEPERSPSEDPHVITSLDSDLRRSLP